MSQSTLCTDTCVTASLLMSQVRGSARGRAGELWEKWVRTRAHLSASSPRAPRADKLLEPVRLAEAPPGPGVFLSRTAERGPGLPLPVSGVRVPGGPGLSLMWAPLPGPGVGAEGPETPPQQCGSQKPWCCPHRRFTMWRCCFLPLESIVLMGSLTCTPPRMNCLPEGYSRPAVYQLSLQRSSPPLTVFVSRSVSLEGRSFIHLLRPIH